MTRAYSERGEATLKNPVAKPMSNAPGSLDFARDDVVIMLMPALPRVFLPIAVPDLSTRVHVKFFPVISSSRRATLPDAADSQRCKRPPATADQCPAAQRKNDTFRRWTRTRPRRLPILVPAFAHKFVSPPAPSCT